MRDAFLDTAHTILHFNHKNALVAHTVVRLVPLLAEYDTATFVGYHLGTAMDLLVRAVGVVGSR